MLAAVPRVMVEAASPEPDGFGPKDPMWDVPWLKGLRRVPKDAIWPRLMTAPHPKAVGSLGPEVARWVLKRRGRRWRWWQRLVAFRLLEVDAKGRLCWETLLLTVARQVGKTWLLRDLCAWRLEAGSKFGAAQEIVSIAKDLAVVRRMQEPDRWRAKRLPELYRVREVNGQEEIGWKLDDSKWMVRSKDGVYSLTVDMATVDEGWKVAANVVDDGLIPTMVERDQAQLLLVSTAHRRASALMIGRRATALDQLADPPADGGMLLIEWSTPRAHDLEDVAGWRQASPHWTAKRERTIAERLAAVRSGESEDVDEPDPEESFRAQWLNQWPLKRLKTERGETLIDYAIWEAAADDTNPVGALVIGVEDNVGQGAAVAFCGQLADGRWVVGGDLCDNRAQAYDLAREACGARDGSQVVVGASLSGDPALADLGGPVVKAGRAETPSALATLRDMLATGQVVQDRSPGLESQALSARVTVGGSGAMTLVGGTRTDLLRAAAWALQRAVREPVIVPAIHPARQTA
jgi:hypothetical protein